MTSGTPSPGELACVLALTHAGALSATELGAWVDAQVAASDVPPSWLTAACLAATPEDKLHHLRDAAGVLGAPDPVLEIEAALVAFDRMRITAEQLARLALHLSWDHKLPGDLARAIYHLDEDARCAHDFDGIPNPTRVSASVRALRAQVDTLGAWRTTLEAVCAVGGAPLPDHPASGPIG